MIYLYLFGTCFHFIYVFMIIAKNHHLTTFGLIAYLMSSQKSAHFRVG